MGGILKFRPFSIRFMINMMRLIAIILFATSIAKLHLASTEHKLLTDFDPIVKGLTVRQILMLSGLVELIIGFLTFSKHYSLRTKAYSILWFVSIALVYRLTLQMIDFKGFCPCLGNLKEILGISGEKADWIALFLLFILTLSALYTLFAEKRILQKTACKII